MNPLDRNISLANAVLLAGNKGFCPGHKAEARRWPELCQTVGVQAKLFAAPGLRLLAVRLLAMRLLAHGGSTRNAKLLTLAVALARCQKARSPQAPALVDRTTHRLQASCQATTHIPEIQRSGRSPGSVPWRSRAAVRRGTAWN